jgi:hypothetical protein
MVIMGAMMLLKSRSLEIDLSLMLQFALEVGRTARLIT